MDDRIERVLNHIEDNLSKSLKLEELAKVACMSSSNFHRIFKKETGRTPFQFIEEIKMQKAYDQLVSKKIKVHKMASDYGYGDYETFSRAFKKHHALAPDDLNAIAQKIQSEVEVGPEGLILKTFEVDDLSQAQAAMDDIVSKLQELAIEKGYTKEDLKKARVMAVTPMDIEVEKKGMVVKNKFLISDNKKIWKKLLNLSEDGE